MKGGVVAISNLPSLSGIGFGRASTKSSMLSPWMGNSMGVWIFLARSNLDAANRLKCTTRNWGSRVRMICLVASRSHLQCEKRRHIAAIAVLEPLPFDRTRLDDLI